MELSLLKNDGQAEGSHRGKHTPLADKVNPERGGRPHPFRTLHNCCTYQMLDNAGSLESMHFHHLTVEGSLCRGQTLCYKKSKRGGGIFYLKTHPTYILYLSFYPSVDVTGSVFAGDGLHGVGREKQGTMGWLRGFPGIWKLKAKLFQPRQILLVVLPRFLKNQEFPPVNFGTIISRSPTACSVNKMNHDYLFSWIHRRCPEHPFWELCMRCKEYTQFLLPRAL